MQIKIINQSPYPLPEYATPQSAGVDLRANITEPLELHPLQHVIVPTGLRLQMPQGCEAQIRPRSGLAAKHGLTVLNSPGTIDADYRGDVGVIIVNLSNRLYTITPGERIAQMVFSQYVHADFQEVSELDPTVRGEGGYGHTGK